MTRAVAVSSGTGRPMFDEALGMSVVVATYKRLERLSACLDGIESQTRAAEEVVVVTHADPESETYVQDRARNWSDLRLVRTQTPGSVVAYNAGLAAASMPLVAYIDDDAVPGLDWLERIVATFGQDQQIAAVGGRDVIVTEVTPGRPEPLRSRPRDVGKIEWTGRMTANHHVGAGPARDVDVLKGVNMAFRRSAVADHGFDTRLRGPGAVVHSELSICLPLRQRGLRIVYDPSIVVRHYPAPRPAGDHRHSLSAEATFNAAHNEGLQIIEYLGPGRRAVFALWSLLIGSTDSPGLAVLMRDVSKRKPEPLARFVAAQRGRAEAWRSRRDKRPNPAHVQSSGVLVTHVASEPDVVIKRFK